MRQEARPSTITRRFAHSVADHIARLALVLLVVEVVAGPFSAPPLFRLGIVVGFGIAAGLAVEGFLVWLERRRPSAQPLT